MSRAPGSFVPSIRSTPSSLAGPLRLVAIVDKSSVDQLKRGLATAMQAESHRLAMALARRGVSLLRDLDNGAGRPFIGRQWTHTAPVTRADGSVSIEIYNRAEEMTFRTRSNAPNSRKSYPIRGDKLLGILLNGAQAHKIARGTRPLQFPAVKGQRQTRFGGAVVDSSGGVSVGRFINANLPNTIVRAQRVNHPGVVGSRFLQATKTRLESAVAAEAENLADRVTARI